LEKHALITFSNTAQDLGLLFCLNNFKYLLKVGHRKVIIPAEIVAS